MVRRKRRLGLGRGGRLCRDRRLVALLQSCGKPESAARTRHALGPGLAAHQFGQAPGNRQPQPGTAVLARGRVVGLLEGAEQTGQRLGFDADAGILDREAQQCRIGILFQQFEVQDHIAAVGEFDGIGGVVEHGLLQARGVARQVEGEGHGLDPQAQALGLDGLGEDGGRGCAAGRAG